MRGGRSLVVVADQGVSSLSNLLGSVAAARASTRSEFGAVAVGLSLYAVTLGSFRALVLEPLLILTATSSRDDNALASTTLASFLFGLVSGFVVVLAGVATGLAAPVVIVGAFL